MWHANSLAIVAAHSWSRAQDCAEDSTDHTGACAAAASAPCACTCTHVRQRSRQGQTACAGWRVPRFSAFRVCRSIPIRRLAAAANYRHGNWEYHHRLYGYFYYRSLRLMSNRIAINSHRYFERSVYRYDSAAQQRRRPLALWTAGPGRAWHARVTLSVGDTWRRAQKAWAPPEGALGSARR
jgi:hypothetical protein